MKSKERKVTLSDEVEDAFAEAYKQIQDGLPCFPRWFRTAAKGAWCQLCS